MKSLVQRLMPNRIFASILTIAVLCVLPQGSAPAAFSAPLANTITIPYQIGFEGYLAGETDGPQSMTFQVWDQPTSGTSLWTLTKTVTVTSGLYSTVLGPFNTSVFANGPRYIGVTVTGYNGGQEITPRTEVDSVPFAINADHANMAESATTATTATTATSANSVPWSGVTGVTVGTGISVDANNKISLLPGFQLPQSGCAVGNFVQSTNGGGWSCVTGVVTGAGTSGQLAIWGPNNTQTGSSQLPAANFPALTGDVTTSVGSLNTTIGAGKVVTADIANGAVTNTKIANSAVGTAQIASQAITSTLIANGAVGSTQVNSNQVQLRGTTTSCTSGTISAIGQNGNVTCLNTPTSNPGQPTNALAFWSGSNTLSSTAALTTDAYGDINANSASFNNAGVLGSVSMGSGVINVGLNVGEVSGAAGMGNIKYQGDLQPYRGGTLLTAYTYVPLASSYFCQRLNMQPLSAGTYTGVVQGTDPGSGSIYKFNGPTGVKAISVRITGQWSSTLGLLLLRSTAMGTGAAVVTRGQVLNIYNDAAGIVPVDSNGQFSIIVQANAASVVIEITGYYI
jgi:hypothetical protein